MELSRVTLLEALAFYATCGYARVAFRDLAPLREREGVGSVRKPLLALASLGSVRQVPWGSAPNPVPLARGKTPRDDVWAINRTWEY